MQLGKFLSTIKLVNERGGHFVIFTYERISV